MSEEKAPRIFGCNGAVLALDPASIQPFNFRDPLFIAPSELRLLEKLHARLALQLAVKLSAFLRMETAVRVTKSESLPYADFAARHADETHLALFQPEPLPGVGVLDFGLKLGLSFANRLLGGKGQLPDVVRPLTEIEIAVVEDAIDLILKEWAQLWTAAAEPIRPRRLGYETSGRFLQIALPTAAFVALEMEVTIGEMTEPIRLGVPFAMIEPLLKIEEPGHRQSVAQPVRQWRAPLDHIAVPVIAEWAAGEMTLRELSNLTCGVVLPMSLDLITQTKVRLSNTREFNGTVGIENGCIAVQLGERCLKF